MVANSDCDGCVEHDEVDGHGVDENSFWDIEAWDDSEYFVDSCFGGKKWEASLRRICRDS